MAPRLSVILCKGRSGQTAQPSLEQELLRALARWPEVEVAVLPHLYDLTSDGPGMEFLRSVPGDMIVLAALYPRAAFWLLAANRIEGQMGRTALVPEEETEKPLAGEPGRADQTPRTIWCMDLRSHPDATTYLREIERIFLQTTGRTLAPSSADEASAHGRERIIDEPARMRWYPVVDYGRCTRCLECLNFCLFGVFGLDESGGLWVEEPDACRNGCPACARVCPAGAIMFPGHATPAVAGDLATSPSAIDLTRIQFFGMPSAQQQAAAERQHALEERAHEEISPPRGDLDRLVDDIDGIEL